MSVPVVQTTATSNTAAATSLAVTMPASVASGDLLVVVINQVNDVGFTTPGGWNASVAVPDAFSSTRSASFWRISDGTEGASVTFNFGGSCTAGAVASRITGFDPTTPVNDADTNQATSGSTSAITSPANVTTVDDCLVMRFGSTRQATGITNPGGQTDLGQATSGSNSTDAIVRGCYASQASAGSTGTAAFTASGTDREWTAISLAIAPVPTTTEQEGYRIRYDDGDEATATWRASQDTQAFVPAGVNFRVRVLLNTAQDEPSSSYQLEVWKDDGGWTAVSTSSDPVKLSASANIPAAGTTATTAQLTPPAGKTTSDFFAGEISDDTNPLPAIDPAADGYTELEWCLQTTAAIREGQYLQFRVTVSGTPVDFYTVYPSVRVYLAKGTATEFLMVA